MEKWECGRNGVKRRTPEHRLGDETHEVAKSGIVRAELRVSRGERADPVFIKGHNRPTAARRGTFAAAKAQHAERTEAAKRSACKGCPKPLGGILNDQGARPCRTFAHGADVDGQAIQVSDDDCARSPVQHVIDGGEVWTERAWVEVIELHREPCADGRRRDIVATVAWQGDNGLALDGADGAQGDLERSSSAVRQDHRARGQMPCQQGANGLEGLGRSTVPLAPSAPVAAAMADQVYRGVRGELPSQHQTLGTGRARISRAVTEEAGRGGARRSYSPPRAGVARQLLRD